MNDQELWTTNQVATFLGGISLSGARKWLRRQGITAVSRQPGRGGTDLYDAGAVRDAYERRTGRGRRTDLNRDNRAN